MNQKPIKQLKKLKLFFNIYMACTIIYILLHDELIGALFFTFILFIANLYTDDDNFREILDEYF